MISPIRKINIIYSEGSSNKWKLMYSYFLNLHQSEIKEIVELEKK